MPRARARSWKVATHCSNEAAAKLCDGAKQVSKAVPRSFSEVRREGPQDDLFAISLAYRKNGAADSPAYSYGFAAGLSRLTGTRLEIDRCAKSLPLPFRGAKRVNDLAHAEWPCSGLCPPYDLVTRPNRGDEPQSFARST